MVSGRVGYTIRVVLNNFTYSLSWRYVSEWATAETDAVADVKTRAQQLIQISKKKHKIPMISKIITAIWDFPRFRFARAALIDVNKLVTLFIEYEECTMVFHF